MAIEGRSDAHKGGRIRLGMVGGGEGAFIGAVHRIASRIDDHYELVAGALSSTPEKARRSGQALGMAADRIYDDYESMAKAEAKRVDGIEAVAIVTPNNVHAGPTYAFLKAGIHVICDKPLTLSLAEAKKMRDAVEKSGLVFALTHNYTGYPLVRRMREMVRAGDLGEIRGKFWIVVAAGDRHPTTLATSRQASGDQGVDRGLDFGARRRQRVIAHHQGAHGRHGLDHARQPAGARRLADGGMEGHHPTVDFGGDFVTEFNGEGGIAAGQVANAHIC